MAELEQDKPGPEATDNAVDEESNVEVDLDPDASVAVAPVDSVPESRPEAEVGPTDTKPEYDATLYSDAPVEEPESEPKLEDIAGPDVKSDAENPGPELEIPAAPEPIEVQLAAWSLCSIDLVLHSLDYGCMPLLLTTLYC